MPDCRGTRPRSRGGRCWYPGGRSNPKHVSEAGAPTPLGFRHPSTPRHGNQSVVPASGRCWEEARATTRQTLPPYSALGKCNLTASTALPGSGTEQPRAGGLQPSPGLSERAGKEGGSVQTRRFFSFSLPLYGHRAVQAGLWRAALGGGRGDPRPPATEKSRWQHGLLRERGESLLRPRSRHPAPSETGAWVTPGDKEGQKRSVRVRPEGTRAGLGTSARTRSRRSAAQLPFTPLSPPRCVKERSDADSATSTPRPTTIIIKRDPQLISPEELSPPR